MDKWCRMEKPRWSSVVCSLFKCGMNTLGWQIATKHSMHFIICTVLLRWQLLIIEFSGIPVTPRMLKHSTKSSEMTSVIYKLENEGVGGQFQNGQGN